ncbi:MAG TPA: hypothetical protein VM492_02815 [Sumerlaeia bacterium]|nr:hypothetical protein [Sumerlaeia bacterium]
MPRFTEGSRLPDGPGHRKIGAMLKRDGKMSCSEKKPRAARRVGLCLLGLVAAAAIVRGIAGSLSASRFEASQARMEGAGRYTRAADLWKPIPPEENAAILWEEMRERATSPIDVEEMLADKPDLVERAGAAPHSLSPEEKALFAGFADRNREFLDSLRRTAERPRYAWLSQDPRRPYHEWEGPGLAGCMVRYRVLFAAAAVAASEGRSEEGVDLWLLGVRSARHFVREPFSTLHFFFGLMVQGMATAGVNAVFMDQPVETDALQAAIRALDPADLWEKWIEVLDKERLGQLEMCREVVEGKATFLSLLGDEEAFAWRHRGQKLLFWAVRPLLQWDLAKMQEEEIEHIDRLRNAGRKWGLGGGALGGEASEKTFPFWRILSREMGWRALPQAGTKVAVTEARIRIARLALACRAWRNDHGAWPASLDDLAPGCIETVPADPFTGRDFVYRVQDDGFVLYSVGRNGRDDEGSAEGDADDLAFRHTERPGRPR